MFSTKLLRVCTRVVKQSRTSSLKAPCRTQRLLVTVQKERIASCAITGFPRCFSVDSDSGHESSKDSSTEENEHQKRKKTEDDIQKEVLENALNYVHTHGWSREALAASAEELGYPTVAEGMFTRGESELVLYFVKSSNQALLHYMDDVCGDDNNKKKTSEFIKDALEHRLRMIIPYIDIWPEAMAILIQPSVVMEATQELGKLVDDIWFYAGDKSADFNWYTKRGLLAKLYVSTQTVMVNDQSPDFADTWEFLDRRMNDIATFGKVTGAIQRQGRMVADIGFADFTVLRNIAGLSEQRR